MAGKLELPLIDFSSPDTASTALAIRQACLDYGFFYLINHGIEQEMFDQLFTESKKFFSLPIDDKMKVDGHRNNEFRGYNKLYDEKNDPSSKLGDLKETFYIGNWEGSYSDANQWPSEETLPLLKVTMETYYGKILALTKRLTPLFALALNLDAQFFESIGVTQDPSAFLRLIHYPGEPNASNNGNYGASAHSDYGMITLLATDGVPGLQICKEKDRQPQLWQDVDHVAGALIVNIGDMLERWTNCLFRSTLHRVLTVDRDRYSAAFFLDPNSDCLVECLETCCSEKSPPRFPPIRSGDYIQERQRMAYSK